MRLGVLASGSGTNLQALIDAQATGRLAPAEIVLTVVNVAGCGALARAEAAGIAARVITHQSFATRADFDQALGDALVAAGVECVVLAGFMRILGESFLARFARGVLNVHPSLLPAFPGINAQQQAFDYGVKVAGCTVHFVDAGVDTGPIVAQVAVPVLDTDDAETLRLRILEQEHKLLPAVVRAHAEGRIVRDGRRIIIRGGLAG